MTDLQVLKLSGNHLVGRVPPSWDSLNSPAYVSLDNNLGLTGCLPRTWEHRAFDFWKRLSAGREGEAQQAVSLWVNTKIQAGTNITVQC
jgi:hypothetical protein